ncbi:hypothetical protein N334_03935, partial [Pelecanus crispus]
PSFLPVFLRVCGCGCGGEREVDHVTSLMFVNCGNSILLNVFFLSEAHICYFKCPSSLDRIE